VENAVLIAERWLLGALRDQTFFSVGEANQAIRPLLIRLSGFSINEGLVVRANEGFWCVISKGI
jgi:hypothetical protein